MAMGMTYDQFWDGDCEMARYYRECHELRKEMDNESMWILGMYVAKAAASAIHGRKAKYPDEPFPMKIKYSKECEERRQEQNERKATDYMMTFMEQFNQRFAAKHKGDANK